MVSLFFSGRVPKIYMLKPEYAIPVTFELFRLIFLKLIGKFPAKQKAA